MISREQLRRSETPGNVPTQLLEGELAANISDRQVFIGDTTLAPVALLAVRFWSATAAYPADTIVVYQGALYHTAFSLAPSPIFNPAQWARVTPGNFPADAAGGLVNDGAGGLSWVPLLARSGGTMTGDLLLASDPTQATQAATKNYVDGIALAAGSVSSVVGKAGAVLLSDLTGAGVAPLASPALTGTPTAPTQSAGDASTKLATDAFVAAALAALPGGYRNRLDNGAMEVQQRGAGSFTTSGSPTADRWLATASSGPVAASLSALSGFGPTRKVLSNSMAMAANATIDFVQHLPAADSFDLAGQTITVSFWGSASTTAGTYQASIFLAVPLVDDTFSGSGALIAQANVTLTGTPGRVRATFAGLTSAVSGGLIVGLRCQQLGATGTLLFRASGAQLEVGPAMSAFAQRPYGDELQRCQRFYQVGTFGVSGTSAFNGHQLIWTQGLPVTMRATPTPATTIASSGGFGSVVVSADNASSVQINGTCPATGAATAYGSFTLSAEP